jgi:hypothetical protein
VLVRPIAGRAELEAVGRMRYERFVVERGCRLPHADDANRILLEPLDAWGVLLGGYAGGELVGSVRLHLGLPDEYRRLYGLAPVGDEHRPRLSLTSRLVVAARIRSLDRAALRLAQGCFEVAAAQGVWLNFIDCNAPLVPFFEALGFLDLGTGPVAHPAFGAIVPMALVLPAVEHFRRRRSPFTPLADRLVEPGEAPAAVALLRTLAPAADLALLEPASCARVAPAAVPSSRAPSRVA